MALVCGIVWIERPEATPLLLIPIVIAFLGYRAYVQEREGHEKVKTLYEANRTLSESPEVAVALEGLLERALEAFHAEQAEVILFAADGGAPLRTSLGPGTAREAMAPLDDAPRPRPCAPAPRAPTPRSRCWTPFPATLDAYLQDRGVRHGMLGVLRGEDRVIGTIMLANRYRPLARLHRRRPHPVRDAGRQRERRASVRPPRARRLRAARPAGPAPAPGPP